MANGEEATAAGLDVVPSTAKWRLGYDEINLTRDYIARLIARVLGVETAATDITDRLNAASPVSAEGRLLAGGPDGRISVGTPITGTNAVNANWVNARLADLPSAAQANGPTSTAYSRNAVGSGFFTTWMNAQLQFMRNTSSRRYKEDIRTAEGLDAAVDALRSGRVRWRQYHRIGQPDGTVELGLIAEECVDIPHLVAWDQARDPETNDVVDEEWRPEAVRYETVLPVYLLEIVQRQNAELVELRARVDELAGR